MPSPTTLSDTCMCVVYVCRDKILSKKFTEFNVRNDFLKDRKEIIENEVISW